MKHIWVALMMMAALAPAHADAPRQALDDAWWNDLRVRLEEIFEQDEIVVRSLEMRRL